MSITLHGPAWPTITALRTALVGVPEVGEFRLGGPPTNAIGQLTAFRAAGLHTPDFTTDQSQAIRWVQDDFMIFGRKLIHTRGNDIILPGRIRLNTRGIVTGINSRWLQSEWWSRYIPPTEEWRVHVFDGKTIARGVKIPVHPPWRKAPVRNIDNGWAFRFDIDPPKGLRKTAKLACEALRYLHGAVDILQVGPNAPGASNAQETTFYILEVNRIPALTCPYTRTAWVEAIRKHVRENR